LKPAVEPIVVARKPLSESTVANNVLKWGTGGLNIDASRIGTDKIEQGRAGRQTANSTSYHNGLKETEQSFVIGRFPANIILDETTAGLLDEQADASRFFYVAKASKKDRNEGLEEQQAVKVTGRDEGQDGRAVPYKTRSTERTNFHPTVKPTKLMEYLVKLVTPVGGTVLDPFTGSGSTGKAALLNGFKFVGCELTEEYLPIIEGRLRFAENKYNETQLKNSETLFDIEEK
jgi:site-specific DNA-methyltransferase (adenine-specific)